MLYDWKKKGKKSPGPVKQADCSPDWRARSPRGTVKLPERHQSQRATTGMKPLASHNLLLLRIKSCKERFDRPSLFFSVPLCFCLFLHFSDSRLLRPLSILSPHYVFLHQRPSGALHQRRPNVMFQC